MSAHTPGPWVATREANGWDVSTVDYVVAECGTDVGSRANARLIAAAPDLLAALREAVADKDKEVAGFRKNIGRDPLVMPEWLNTARAAIVKAEGRS